MEEGGEGAARAVAVAGMKSTRFLEEQLFSDVVIRPLSAPQISASFVLRSQFVTTLPRVPSRHAERFFGLFLGSSPALLRQ